MSKIWQVDKTVLANGVAMLGLIPMRPGVPSSVYARITKHGDGIAVMSAAEATGVAYIKGLKGWPFEELVLDRRLSFPFLQAAKNLKSDAPVQFELDGKSVVVTQGKRKATFSAAEGITGFGAVIKVDSVTKAKLSTDLVSKISVAAGCATHDTVVPELCCVQLDQDGDIAKIYSSNQMVVFAASLKGVKVPKVPFPLFLVPYLGDATSVYWLDKQVALRMPEGLLWQSVSAAAAKSFPIDVIKSRVAIAKKWPTVFQMDCGKLRKVVDRLVVYLGSVNREDWVLKVEGKADSKELSLTVKIQQTSFNERIQAEAVVTEDFSIDWPLEYLVGVLTYWSKDKGQILSCKFGKEEYEVKGKGGKVRTKTRSTPYFLSAGDTSLIVSRRVS